MKYIFGEIGIKTISALAIVLSAITMIIEPAVMKIIMWVVLGIYVAYVVAHCIITKKESASIKEFAFGTKMLYIVSTLFVIIESIILINKISNAQVYLIIALSIFVVYAILNIVFSKKQ